jgi:hypothetical protein
LFLSVPIITFQTSVRLLINNQQDYREKNMYRKTAYVAAFCALSVLTMGLSHAEEEAEQLEPRVAITGNTTEGKIVKRDVSYKMYFHPSGRVVQLDSDGNTAKGTWLINSDGELCLTLGSENCYTIIKRDDKGFDLLDQQGELILTIDKVIIGNPDKMKP